MIPLTESHVPLQVSKWIKIGLLIDIQEMENLFHHLPPFFLYDIQKVCHAEEGVYSPQFFLKEYGHYIDFLKRGTPPPLKTFRPLFSLGWSVEERALYALTTQDGRRLIKAKEPIVQTQSHEIGYSHEEKTFRTQIFGSNTISWGIQLGFPFLYMSSETYEAESTRRFANMTLFSTFQRWIRSHTIPTPFLIGDSLIHSPIRLGKECLSWIASHPQLKPLNIHIKGALS